MLSKINMIHVDERYRISVLIIVKAHTNFFEEKLYVKARNLIIHFMVHNDLPSPLNQLDSFR